MGYASGIRWTSKHVDKLKEYTLLGYNVREMSSLFKKQGLTISPNSIEMAKHRYSVFKYCLERDDEIATFKEETLPMDDYAVSADYHSPYYSHAYINRMLCVCRVLGITKHVIGGDLVDCDFAKFFYSDETSTLDKEIKHTDPLFKALNYFDINYLIHGNHENRINRSTDGKVQARHILKLYGEEIWKNKFQYSTYDKLNIGADWMVVHPKSYSQIGGNVAVRLAEKFNRNVLNAHGHFVALRWDRSGEHMGIDLGGMFDTTKTEYINKKTTTHPFWNNGFVIIKNGKPYLFNESTDWDWWLNGKNFSKIK